MKALPQEKLSEVILEFSSQERSVLFTGAGVGKCVGFPLWSEYIEYLAQVCAAHGAEHEATLMKVWASQGSLIEAAGIYEMSKAIPIGERWRRFAEPFTMRPSDERLQPLTHIFTLPFQAVVTTNYDSSQHAAYSLVKHQFPRPVEREGTSAVYP
jgi:hypothetical protein